MKYDYEFTDTFGGEANYCWVKRGTIEADSDLSAVRKAKAAVGITDWPCKRDHYGDQIVLKLYRSCTILFVTHKED